MSQRWRQVATATIAGDGTGTAEITPPTYSYYRTRLMRLNTTPASPGATATIYRGDTGPTSEVEGSYSGDGDTSDTVIELEPGEQLLCFWAGATAGSSAMIRVEGTSSPDGQF